MTINANEKYTKLRGRLIHRTGSARSTSFERGQVIMSLSEYERLVTYAEQNKSTYDVDMYEAMLTHEKGVSDSINREPVAGDTSKNIIEAEKHFLKAQVMESVIVPSEPVVVTPTPNRARDAEQVLRLIEIIKETGGAVEIKGVRIEPMKQVERRGK